MVEVERPGGQGLREHAARASECATMRRGCATLAGGRRFALARKQAGDGGTLSSCAAHDGRRRRGGANGGGRKRGEQESRRRPKRGGQARGGSADGGIGRRNFPRARRETRPFPWRGHSDPPAPPTPPPPKRKMTRTRPPCTRARALRKWRPASIRVTPGAGWSRGRRLVPAASLDARIAPFRSADRPAAPKTRSATA